MANSEVYLNIKKLCNELLPEALAKGLEKAGQIVENDAKRNCPVDDGQLKASITHIVNTEEANVSIGTNVEHGIYVHEGTGIYNPEGRKTPWIYTTADGETYISHGQEANPFLQSAVDNNLNKIVEQFENLL
jgi:HK97 gp10 family phage protein